MSELLKFVAAAQGKLFIHTGSLTPSFSLLERTHIWAKRWQGRRGGVCSVWL